jgi:DNA adenine methylase
LIEPFAGGGIVGLTAAFEGLAERVLLIELDEQVASVWKSILGGEGEWLAERIVSFRMNHETLTEELSKKGGSVRETAFRTLLRNRTSHGGIMAPGAGSIKYGESGKGIASRWYPGTLAKRICDIHKIRNRIDFIQGNGIETIREHIDEKETVYFIDPPYTAAGKKAGARLYAYNELNHEELFTLAESLQGEFIMTYDNADGVRAMALRHGFDVVAVPMKNTHHTTMDELIISKNLGWVK